MEHAYARGLRCHRDLKPSNILIGRDGSQAKVSDFGLAGVLAPRPGTTFLARPGQNSVVLSMCSERGVAVGTPTHMPPEQFIDAGLCDERSDIHSFGVVLFEMVAGLLPFLASPPRGDCQDDVERFMTDMYRLHCDAAPPSVGSPLGAVIGMCLQKYPGLRYQAFRDLRNELESVFRTHFGQTPPIPKPGDMGATEWNNRGLSLQAMGRTEEALIAS